MGLLDAGNDNEGAEVPFPHLLAEQFFYSHVSHEDEIPSFEIIVANRGCVLMFKTEYCTQPCFIHVRVELR